MHFSSILLSREREGETFCFKSATLKVENERGERFIIIIIIHHARLEE
jgi:hypothetical protein